MNIFFPENLVFHLSPRSNFREKLDAGTDVRPRNGGEGDFCRVCSVCAAAAAAAAEAAAEAEESQNVANLKCHFWHTRGEQGVFRNCAALFWRQMRKLQTCHGPPY